MARILVVEDDLLNLDNLTEILEFNGYDVIPATGGQEAIALLQTSDIDLILCDWLMAGVTGLNVLQDVRSSAHTKGIPFIMLTAFARDSDRREVMALGADAYITKPFNFEELLSAIAFLLNDT